MCRGTVLKADPPALCCTLSTDTVHSSNGPSPLTPVQIAELQAKRMIVVVVLTTLFWASQGAR